ncbi:MAG: DUF86 domain-containing protein [Thermoplasmatota archaeon]
MIDEERILDHLNELEASLRDWKRYKAFPVEKLKTDRDTRNMVLHAMLVAIQSSIDVANHLIAEKNLRKPSTYREAFEILAEENVISVELADELAELAGFRNMLVHIYWRLDMDVIHEILQHDHRHLEAFSSQVKKMLASD